MPSKLAYRITKVQTAEQLLGGPPGARGAGGAAVDDDRLDDAFDDGHGPRAADAFEGDALGTRTPAA